MSSDYYMICTGNMQCLTILTLCALLMLQCFVHLSVDAESNNDIERVDSVVEGITVESNPVGESAYTSQGIVRYYRVDAHISYVHHISIS